MGDNPRMAGTECSMRFVHKIQMLTDCPITDFAKVLMSAVLHTPLANCLQCEGCLGIDHVLHTSLSLLHTLLALFCQDCVTYCQPCE